MEKKDKIFIGIVAAVVFLDQITKFLVLRFAHKPIEIIKDVFYINFLKNTGAGFSLFAKIQNANAILMFVTLFIVGMILFNYDKIERNLHFYFALIIGGAIGNLIDRVLYGYVVDFFDFRVFPVFNIADSAISLAGIFILISLFTIKKTKGSELLEKYTKKHTRPRKKRK